MDMLNAALMNLATVSGLSFLMLGVLVGFVFGAIPGVGGTTALAMLIPLTFGLSAQDAILMLGGVMGASTFGGSITAILINTPGTSSNAATCLDGHPMAQQGKAGMAIGAAATSSAVGGVFAVILFLMILPFAKVLILAFGPPEFFLLAIIGLAAVALSTGNHFLRGLITAAAGLLLAMVGFDDVGGRVRFTGGIDHLWDGISLIPTLIGLFAVAEMIRLTVDGGTVAKETDFKVTGVMKGVSASFRNFGTLLKGSFVGAIVGIVPGVGGTVAGFLAYSLVAQTSKDPDSFGKGNIQGVIAPEAANNAKDGGSLVPTLTFGIPGSAETAIFLGALVIHGIQPGPMLLIHNEHIIFSLIIALTLSCILASLIGLVLARHLTLVTRVDASFLVPVVLSISFLGTFAVRNSFGDVVLAMIFGLVGYIMIRFDFPRITLIIGLVLGGLAERSFHQSLMISRGDYTTFFSSTLSKGLILALVLSMAFVAVQRIRRAGNAT